MDIDVDDPATLDDANGAAPAEVPDGSILGSLIAKRQRLAATEAPTRDFVVPEYDERLIVRYIYPEGGYQAAVKAAERELQAKDPQARLNGASDLLIVSCGSFLGRKPDGTTVNLLDETPVPDGQLPEQRLTFDRRLAEALRIEVPPTVANVGRFVARRVFSPRGPSRGEWDGDLALISQSNQLFRWLNKAEADLDAELAGE